MFLFSSNVSETAAPQTQEHDEEMYSSEAMLGDFALIVKVNELNELKVENEDAENLH